MNLRLERTEWSEKKVCQFPEKSNILSHQWTISFEDFPLKLMLCCTFCTFSRGQKQGACWEAVPDTNTRQGVWSLTWMRNPPDSRTACFSAHISEEWTHQTMWKLDFSNCAEFLDMLETQIIVGWKWLWNDIVWWLAAQNHSQEPQLRNLMATVALVCRICFP